MEARRLSIQRILCPTDFSDFAARALDRAVGLARWWDARVTALHVMPISSPAMILASAGDGSVMVPEDLLREQREEAAAELERLVAAHLGQGVAIGCTVTEGIPDVEIGKVAAALPADLVVMGTHGRSGFDRFLLGSTTEKALRRIGCPVLTVGLADRFPRRLFHRILCATDLGAGAERTVELALFFAQETVARITLLHVVEGQYPIDRALEQLHRLGKPASAFGDVEVLVETGTAWREIVRVAGETGADLIVAGAHVSGAFGAFFLGSTANQVLRHAPCPVLIARDLRPAEATPDAGRADHVVAQVR